MFKRLGNVLYWIGCILAGIAVLVGVAFLFMPGEALFFVMACFSALAIWVTGLALRYILGG